MQLLTVEDKKVLRSASRYMQSMGLSSGLLDLEFYDVNDYDINLEDEIPFGKPNTVFSNHYNVRVPEEMFPVVDKILRFCSDKMSVYEDTDYLNYIKLEIEIDSEEQIIFAIKYWGFVEAGDSEGHEWDMNESEEVKNIIEQLKELVPNRKELILDYNGSGDSGYIESQFSDSSDVPRDVEDWCYSELENLHGGWEINEGSTGYFKFDLENGIINLEHTMNNDVDKSDTLFEEKFGK